MDFFEVPGSRHYRGSPISDDKSLRELCIDRIHDRDIDEEQFPRYDATAQEIAEGLDPQAPRRWSRIFGPVLAGEHK
ncbi:MAG: deoxyhypusine synthase family protein [Planctomycetota bacterium]|nr:deoxyhypusine synthase family protein [Phycisphaerae bacterium]MCY2950560.1 deoxyhypusine synthase family protein [Planctomycetota bacterium]